MNAVVEDISYQVVRSRRRTADIVVERDGRVVVRAPVQVTAEKIAEIVRLKRLWIYRTLAEWRESNVKRFVREYRNGESFLYLGRSYRLSLVSDQSEPLLLKAGRFCLRRDLVDGGDNLNAKAAFRDFYLNRGRERLDDRVAYYAPKVGVLPLTVGVRDLGYRWASCSPTGRLAFHWKCLMAPATIIDYIVVHELSHLHQLDHTDAFWNEVDKVMPDYRERKDWLRVHGVNLDL
jgi:predicted metal-dependent hydrolase